MTLEQRRLIFIQGTFILKIGDAWHLFWCYLSKTAKFSSVIFMKDRTLILN